MQNYDRKSQEKNENQKTKNNLKVIGIVIAIIGIGIILYLLFLGNGLNTRSDDVSLSDIDQEAQRKPVVLYFWSGGCYYCNEQKPIIEELEHDYGTANVTFYWIDSGKHKELTDHYEIRGYPTTVVLNQSGIVQKNIGYTDYGDIASGINEAIESYS
ncbi:thioredoxin family protein [[Eubacterium] cellulosolvens]